MLRQRNPRGRLRVRLRDSGEVVIGLTDRVKWSDSETLVLRGEMDRLAREGRRRITLDLVSVSMLPSGFFGMLCGWLERFRGQLQLMNVESGIRRTLWFELFTEPVSEQTVRVSLEPKWERESEFENRKSAFEGAPLEAAPATLH